MSLKKFLRGQGYDLIDGPVRNHKPLQLWVKKLFDEIELYYANIDHAFISSVALNEITNDALSVNSSKKDDYSFNIGITLLEDILKSLGLAGFELSAKIKSGKKVTISYDNSLTKEYPVGELENYLSNADFRHHNPALLKNANRNNILIISGVVFAKNLVVEIETNFELTTELVAGWNKISEGKIDFAINNSSKLKMVTSGTGYFPIAVKANRIEFDKGTFRKLMLVTDNRNFF
jgi:hypothetical protein